MTVDPTPELARIEALISTIERDARQAAQERAESGERRAVEARAGRMGPDWQEVQRGIDAGETSVEDVFTGRDQTPAARRLVDLSQRNLAELGDVLQQDDQMRVELAEVDRELSQWDPPEPDAATAAGQPVDPTMGRGADSGGVRSATDPTAGAGPVSGGSDQASPTTPHHSGAAPHAAAPRDPVADRVDATGLEPEPRSEPVADLERTEDDETDG